MNFIESVLANEPLSIDRGIFRFVPGDNYSYDFGEEWKRFGRIQYDAFTGRNLSEDRFYKTTLFSSANNLQGLNVLDAGCGAGRHSDIALQLKPKNLVCVDMSHAIDLCRINLLDAGRSIESVHFVQADISKLPFRSNSFDIVYCMGVIQHTPNPLSTLLELVRVLKPSGKIVVDTYKKSFKSYTHLQGLWRLFFRLIGRNKSKQIISNVFPRIYPIHRRLMNYPLVNSLTWKLLPFDSSFPKLDLSPAEELQWFLMSVEDGYLSKYILPQTKASFYDMGIASGLSEVEVIDQSYGDAAPLVLRGIKPLTSVS